MKQAISPLLQIGLCILSCLYATSEIVQAQVITDGTVNTQVNQSGNVSEITGGQTRDGNLFHSFQEFSVGLGNEAFFDNADTVKNILSRVTGGNISNINGLIRANGNANLFLINPTGIIFGEGARLNLGGSFYGSSADSILFPDGVEFSATNSQAQPILTINAPIGLNFRSNPGDITVTGDGLGTRNGNDLIDTENALRVNSTSTFGLIGGNLNLEGATIKTNGGRIELGSVAGDQQVSLTEINEGWSVGYGGIDDFDDIQLSQTATIDASGVVSGDIQVRGNKITLTNGSRIQASTLGDALTQETPGIIEINATDTITLDGESASGSSSGVLNTVNSGAVGDAGNVNIFTNSLKVTNGAQIDASTLGKGNAGSVTIDAENSIIFAGEDTKGRPGAARSQVASGAVGNAGGVTIRADSLELRNGAQIDASTLGKGNAGSVTINATGNITFDGFTSKEVLNSGAFSIVNPKGTGDAGGVNITADSLNVSNGARVDASTFGKGNAGSVTINTTGNITFDGEDIEGFTSAARSHVASGAVGNAGGVKITTGSLNVSNGAQIDTNTGGEGNAGSVTINATDNITFDGVGIDGDFNSGAVSIVNTAAEGDAGGINITTGSLNVINGARVDASTFGNGNAGSVTINATDNITFDGIGTDGAKSGANSQVASGAVGNAGGVKITADSLNVTNGAQIDTNTSGKGNAGSVTIDVADNITFDGVGIDGDFNSGAASIVNTKAEGDAGGVNITTGSLNVNNGARIDASTFGKGNAGSVTIDAADYVTFDGIGTDGARSGANSQVASGAVGNAGGVNITADSLNVNNGARIDVSTFGNGNAGTLSVQSNSLSLDNDATINAATQSGTGGNITLQIAEDLNLRNNSSISARAFQAANGGNLSIDARFIVAFPSNGSGNDIVATADAGNGGRINLNSEQILNLQEQTAIDNDGQFINNGTNDIDASSQTGLAGNILINIFNPDVIEGIIELPVNIVAPEKTTAAACQSDLTSDKPSGLTVKGKGGVPPAPDLPLNSQTIMVNGKDVTTETNQAQYHEIKPIPTSHGDILPAQGVVVTKDGRVILTAYRTDTTARVPQSSANCGQL